MLEVEVKASVPDVETLRRRLRSLGAKRLGAERERDDYFQHPRRDFRRTDEALRLRFRDATGRRAGAGAEAGAGARAAVGGAVGGAAGHAVELTYKGPKLDRRTKSRVELTVKADAKVAAALLGALGFRRSGIVVKRREHWRLRGSTVAVDDVEGLGAFVEVERVVDAAPGSPAFAAARDACLRLLRDLGLRGSERRSYLELLDRRRPRRGKS